ncbi:MAG: hypothetical protein ACRBN8_39215 [Nannocystales bacterium]
MRSFHAAAPSALASCPAEGVCGGLSRTVTWRPQPRLSPVQAQPLAMASCQGLRSNTTADGTVELGSINFRRRPAYSLRACFAPHRRG